MWNPQPNDERSQMKEGAKNVAAAAQEGKEAVQGQAAEMGRHLGEQIHQGKERIKHAASSMETNLRNDPWPTVAGIAVASLLVGFALGTSRR